VHAASLAIGRARGSMSRIGKARLGFFETVGGFLAERGLTFRAEVPFRPVGVTFGSDGPQLAADGTIFLQQLFEVESEFRSSVVRHDLGSIIYVILAVKNSKKR
jgi:hypothetical protein